MPSIRKSSSVKAEVRAMSAKSANNSHECRIVLSMVVCRNRNAALGGAQKAERADCANNAAIWAAFVGCSQKVPVRGS